MAKPGAPDTIFVNGKITTLDPAQPGAAAIALAGGTVAAVGSDRDLRALGRGQDQSH